MENGKINKECFHHEGKISTFYCFDDKQFLCDHCFKEHRKHNLEIISVVEKNEKIYKKIRKDNTMTDSLEEIKEALNELRNDIEEKLNKINNMLFSLKHSTPFPNSDSIYNLNFQEYENLEAYLKLIESLNELDNKLIKLKKYKIINKYINLREINKEVNIIGSSRATSGCPLDIMLGKSLGVYSLFEGTNNHFAIFDLQKNLYLKEILISVKQKYNYGCVLKNFKVSIKNNFGNWEEVNSFICQRNEYEIDMQAFPIERETQFVRIDFIDTWSNIGGNYILIRKLSFKVADII